jgi:hypothetical protein
MAEKKLKISIDLDERGFQSAVKKMTEQLNQINSAPQYLKLQKDISQKMQKMGLGGMAGAPTDRDIQKAQEKAKQDVDKAFQDSTRKLTLSKKMQQELAGEIKKVNDRLKEGNVEEGERLKLLEREKSLYDKMATAKQAEKNATAGAAAIMKRQEMERGAAGKGGTDITLGGVAKAAAAVMGLMTAGSALYMQYRGMEMQRAQTIGRGTESLLGGPLREAMTGGPAQFMAFSKERSEAMGMARKMAEERTTPVGMLSQIGSGGGSALVALLTKSISDNIEKSFIGGAPGVSDITKTLHGAADKYLDNFSANVFAKMGEEAEKTITAKIMADPAKQLASQFLDSRFTQDLQTQRMLGLGFSGFHGAGGFQERANKAGFDMDLAAQMSSQIQSAGGSTRAMGGGAITALQAQRGFDMTNAGTVMGRIGGSVGDADRSQQIFKKIIEESMRSGLDKSEFREEQRRFADATSEILSKTGVKTTEEAQDVIRGFSKLLGPEPTVKGMDAARSVYQQFQEMSAATSGRGGALQFSSFMKQPALKKMGYSGVAGLMEMPEQDINASNEFIIAAAAQAGVKPEEIVKQVKEAKRQEKYAYVGMDYRKVDKLNQSLTKAGYGKGERLSSEQLAGLDEETRKNYIDVMQRSRIGIGYQGPQAAEAAFRGYLGGEEDTDSGAAKRRGELVQEKLDKKETGRVEDKMEQARAEQSQAMLENFRNFKDAVTPATEALGSLTRNVLLLSEALKSIPEKDRGYAAAVIGKRLEEAEKAAAGRQTQAGKSTR